MAIHNNMTTSQWSVSHNIIQRVIILAKVQWMRDELLHVENKKIHTPSTKLKTKECFRTKVLL